MIQKLMMKQVSSQMTRVQQPQVSPVRRRVHHQSALLYHQNHLDPVQESLQSNQLLPSRAASDHLQCHHLEVDQPNKEITEEMRLLTTLILMLKTIVCQFCLTEAIL